MDREAVLRKIDPERIRDGILRMVEIPSPPGQERAVAEYYAGWLRGIGVDVEIDREFPDSPSVIGRVKGGGNGVLQLDGHLDTIVTPGPPVRCEDGVIYGRGTADMKGDLICMAEAVRALIEAGVKLPGDLLLTAHGQHESGTNETLESLIRKGIHGDAVIVTEGYSDRIPVAGLGLGIWEIRITIPGDPIHENEVPPGTPNPLLAGVRAVALLQERQRELQQLVVEHLGPESIFIGSFRCGDYFNRMPVSCVITGSRRFGPDTSLDDVRREFERLGRQVASETGATVVAGLTGGLESFRIREDEPILAAIRRAHRLVHGSDIPLAGMRTAGNLSNFVKGAGIPGVYYGVDLKTAHSDHECVTVENAVQVTQVFIHAILEYFGV